MNPAAEAPDFTSLQPVGTGPVMVPPMLLHVRRGRQLVLVATSFGDLTTGHLAGFEADDDATVLVETAEPIGVARWRSIHRLMDLAAFFPVTIPPPRRRGRKRHL